MGQQLHPDVNRQELQRPPVSDWFLCGVILDGSVAPCVVKCGQAFLSHYFVHGDVRITYRVHLMEGTTEGDHFITNYFLLEKWDRRRQTFRHLGNIGQMRMENKWEGRKLHIYNSNILPKILPNKPLSTNHSGQYDARKSHFHGCTSAINPKPSPFVLLYQPHALKDDPRKHPALYWQHHLTLLYINPTLILSWSAECFGFERIFGEKLSFNFTNIS